jgi:hypothetical protein
VACLNDVLISQVSLYVSKQLFFLNLNLFFFHRVEQELMARLVMRLYPAMSAAQPEPDLLEKEEVESIPDDESLIGYFPLSFPFPL